MEEEDSLGSKESIGGHFMECLCRRRRDSPKYLTRRCRNILARFLPYTLSIAHPEAIMELPSSRRWIPTGVAPESMAVWPENGKEAGGGGCRALKKKKRKEKKERRKAVSSKL
ncbi:hypothetical protein JCGZ_17247 [Jatropha curcas]|uniref:Uncharacterized protein n=1 Tax=Jatropha curcas TaxID=180498 RepID=A0A067LLJ7_JATCU|nr:hypothetical protein JCGZ_17247 [Jatropha curcas]